MSASNTKLSFVGKLKDLAHLSSFVTIQDNSTVMVENCSRVYECSDIMAKVSAGKYYIEIWGKNLSMSEYSQDCISIDGVIDSVRLIMKGFTGTGERDEKER